jgi:uncharacterized protein YerC
MISLELSTIHTKDAERAWLAEAMAAYQRGDGIIGQIESPSDLAPKPEDKPVALRKDLSDIFRSESYTRQMAETAEKKALEDRVRKLSETMTYLEAMAETGLSHTTLYRISRAGCFYFRRKSHEITRRRAYVDRVADAKLCERMKALRDIGLSRYQVAKQLEVAGTVITRLMRDYGIDFPSQKPRRCAG